MNIPQAFEKAIQAVIRNHSGLDPMPHLRTFHGVGTDQGWTVQTDRVLPVVLIVCGNPRVSPENGNTASCNLAVTVATNANDDITHERMTTNNAGVCKCLDALYAQFLSGSSTGAEIVTFNAALSGAFGSSPVPTVGGFEYCDPPDPTEDGGVVAIGLAFIVHFSRSDF